MRRFRLFRESGRTKPLRREDSLPAWARFTQASGSTAESLSISMVLSILQVFSK